MQPSSWSSIVGSRLPGLARAATLALGCLVSLTAHASVAPESFADLAARVTPAVVNVSTTQEVTAENGPERPQFPPGSPLDEFFKKFFDQQGSGKGEARKVSSLGSGFIIDATGYVVTNNHVIGEATAIKVTLSDNTTTYDAKLVGRDTRTDLALLKIQPKTALPTVAWGNSEKARVGDWVIAVGDPFGLGGSVTAGIISARARNINAGPYDDFLQTDAAINKGNSGGPMFNMDGEVIGINTAILSPTGGSVGIGFAIPSALARPVIDSIRNAGKVTRGYLGVQIQPVTPEIAEAINMKEPKGALVTRVTEGGPSANSGIKTGDVIIGVADQPVADPRSLQRIVAGLPVDKETKLLVYRDGQQLTLSVRVGTLPDEAQLAGATTPPAKAPGGVKQSEILGMTLQAPTPELRRQFEIGADAVGVIVSDVAANSAAAEKGVQAGDLIIEIDRHKVGQVADVGSLVKEAKTAGRKSVLMLVEHQGNRRYVAVPVS